jgi:hypothetical protein
VLADRAHLLADELTGVLHASTLALSASSCKRRC